MLNKCSSIRKLTFVTPPSWRLLPSSELPILHHGISSIANVFGSTCRFQSLQHLEAGADIDTIICRRLLDDRLFRCFHDIGQARVTRLVEAEIRGDDGRQFQSHRLQATINFARYEGISSAGI